MTAMELLKAAEAAGVALKVVQTEKGPSIAIVGDAVAKELFKERYLAHIAALKNDLVALLSPQEPQEAPEGPAPTQEAQGPQDAAQEALRGPTRLEVVMADEGPEPAPGYQARLQEALELIREVETTLEGLHWAEWLEYRLWVLLSGALNGYAVLEPDLERWEAVRTYPDLNELEERALQEWARIHLERERYMFRTMDRMGDPEREATLIGMGLEEDTWAYRALLVALARAGCSSLSLECLRGRRFWERWLAWLKRHGQEAGLVAY